MEKQNENLLWHFRLGHVSWEKLKHVHTIKKNEVLNICRISIWTKGISSFQYKYLKNHCQQGGNFP